MASQGPNGVGTGANTPTTGNAWSNPGNVTASDDARADVILGGSGNATESEVKLIIGGTVSGTSKSTGAVLPSADTYVSYGGASDLWGTAPTYSDVNASNFGVSFVANLTVAASDQLWMTNFGFSIPTGSTIDGILVEIEHRKRPTLAGGAVDHCRITVYYTAAASGGTVPRRRSSTRTLRAM